MKLIPKNGSLCASGAGGGIGFLLGSLQVLIEAGYKFKIAVGVSSGALLALMYAMGKIDRLGFLLLKMVDAEIAKKRLLAYGFRLGAFKLGLSDPLFGMYDNRPLFNLLRREMLNQKILIDYTCVSVNAKTGKEMWWQIPAGTVFTQDVVDTFARMVLSSTAIPGFFPATNINGTYYTDGGSSTHTPIEPTKQLMPDADHITILTSAGYEKEPVDKIKSDMDHVPARASEVLSKVAEVDFLKFHYKNELARCGCREDLKYFPSTIIDPAQELAPIHRFHHKFIVKDIAHGRQRALAKLYSK